ncbi:MAG: putative Prostaglandin F synthase [Streblomastix strix]|uniref:Putative Prostaglandin F synthase n=1 Tax=Streblomastix strix TaxID=222440 RepID=A0A5J4WJH0_9EUKA|nr:MAG: putative Prostaglandin F synthase [Streblomastix strix]
MPYGKIKRVKLLQNAGYIEMYNNYMVSLEQIQAALERSQNPNDENTKKLQQQLEQMEQQNLVKPHHRGCGYIDFEKVEEAQMALQSMNNKIISGKSLKVRMGTWRLTGSECEKALKDGYDVGFRLFDSASMYDNEQDIYTGLKKAKIEPSHIIIQSKLLPENHGYESTGRAFEESWKNITKGERPLDVYLIHWPGTNQCGLKKTPSKIRRETWKKMEEVYRQDKVRAIGVSNYEIKHLEEFYLNDQNIDIFPSINQIELHPKLNQKSIVDYCQQRNIIVEAYMPFGEGNLISDKYLKKISESLQKPSHGPVTVPQMLLRYYIQRKIVPLPKSQNIIHLQQNANVFNFELDENEMEILNRFQSEHGTQRFDWDPSRVN